MQPSADTGGSSLVGHEVWLSSGGVLTQDTSYDGASPTHVVAGLAAGQVYRVSVRSLNSVAYSDWSPYLEAAASSLPSAPVAGSLRKDSRLSSKTTIMLEWDKVPD